MLFIPFKASVAGGIVYASDLNEWANDIGADTVILWDENDDIYDILWYAGARRNKSDKTRRSGLRFPTNSQGMLLGQYFSVTPSFVFTFLVLFSYALQASRPNPKWLELGCTTCPREPSRPPSTVTPSTATPGAGPRRRT